MDVSRFDKRRLLVARCALGFASFKVAQSSLYSTAMLTSETTTVLIAGLDFSIASAAFVVLTEAVIVRYGGAWSASGHRPCGRRIHQA